MGRRSNNGNWFWIFFILLIFPGIIEGFLPLLAVGLAIWAFFSIVQNANKEANRTRRGTRYSSRRQTRYASGDTLHSPDKKARVNVYLMKRFRSTRKVELVVNGRHIMLTNPSENYRTMEQLQVNADGRRYSTMDNFRRANGDLYNCMFDAILDLAKNASQASEDTSTYASSYASGSAASTGGPVVDAEFVPQGQRFQDDEPQRDRMPAEDAKDQISSKAEQFRSTINDLNNDIPDDAISNALYETSALLKQLGELEVKFPKSSDKLTKLYETYLPYLVQILQQYARMQNVATDPNYKENEENLKKTINHINAAIRDRLIPSMSEYDSSNLAADMNTLDAMLRRDGMSDENDITAMLRKQQNQTKSQESV